MTQDQKLMKWATIAFGTFVLGMVYDPNLLKSLADLLEGSSKSVDSPECIPKICGDESCMIKTYCKHYKGGK